MKKELIASKELKSKMQEIIFNQTNIDITLKESDKIIKEFFDYIKFEVCNGNEVLINNFCKFMLKKYKKPKKDNYYDYPVVVFSNNFFRKESK